MEYIYFEYLKPQLAQRSMLYLAEAFMKGQNFQRQVSLNLKKVVARKKNSGKTAVGTPISRKAGHL